MMMNTKENKLTFLNVVKKASLLLSLCFVYLKFILNGNNKYFKIFTLMTRRERLLLYKFALSLKENSTIVEIGSYLGASSAFLACAAKKKKHKLYCCDTWKNDTMKEGSRDTFDEFCHNIESLKEHICILRGKSIDIAKTFNEIIDLIFIDGDHAYEAVKADIEAWLPKVKEGGVIIFHDYGGKPGVTKAINEHIKPITTKTLVVDSIYLTRK